MIKKYKTGQIGEMRIHQEMLKLGYDVFDNVCAQGPIDLVIVNLDNMKSAYVDVKSITAPYYRDDGSKALKFGNKLGLKDGIWNIGYVHSDDEIVYPEGFFESFN